MIMEKFKILSDVLSGVILPVFITQEITSIVNDGVRLNKILKYENCLIKDKNVLDISKDCFKCDTKTLPLVESILNYVDSDIKDVVLTNFGNVRITKDFVDLLLASNGYNLGTKEFIQYSLVHAASYKRLNDGIILSGFIQQDDDVSIGNFLSNSYALLLTNRIFNNGLNIFPKSYSLIAKKVEEIFDDSKDMENLFFTHDLPGFVKYLEHYMTRNEIISLLVDMDTYHFDRRICNPMCIFDNYSINNKLDFVKKKAKKIQ